MGKDNSWGGSERRRHRRYPVANLHGVLDASHEFEVLILSEGGLLLRMEEGVQLRRTVIFELGLSGEKIRGTGRVVFSTGEPGPEGVTVRRVGLEFVELDDKSRRALSRHVAVELV